MTSIVFDTSSIISIVSNNLTSVLEPLKKEFKGEFYIPASVKYELVDKPMTIKRFKLEAMMIKKIIDNNLLKTYHSIEVDNLLHLMNNIYSVRNKGIHILDRAEVEALALVSEIHAEAYVVDERTMRLVIEDPIKLHNLLERKLQTKIDIDIAKVKQLSKMFKGVKVIRSTELMLVALEKGLLKDYFDGNSKKEFVDALLWGLRLRGSAISTEEIEDLIKLESRP